MTPRPWKTLASRILLDRWWMRLREDRVQLPTGAVLDEFHVAEYPDWACVVALTDDGQAVMVAQYRYGIARMSLEFPAGALDAGEDPLTAAQRELREETGFAARRWIPLGKLAIEPSRHTNYGHLFLAEGAYPVGDAHLDASEDLALELVPVSALIPRAESGEIIHGIHAAALYRVARQMGW